MDLERMRAAALTAAKSDLPAISTQRDRKARLRLLCELHGWSCPILGVEPSSYGLSADELRAEATRLAGRGWSAAEIRHRLADPRRVMEPTA